MKTNLRMSSLVVALFTFLGGLSIANAAEENPAGIGLLARIHFNTQTSDFDRTREFYRQLGYTQGISAFPMTNTHLIQEVTVLSFRIGIQVDTNG